MGRRQVVIAGIPSGPRPRRDGTTSWRERVAAAAADAALPSGDGVRLDFTLRPGQFIDLDTLAQTALAGLRDAGAYPRGFAGLEVVVARKTTVGEPGLLIATTSADRLRGIEPPGRCDLSVSGAAPGTRRAGKVAWRSHIASAWGARPVLAGEVWAEVAMAVDGSILGPLEPVLDALEPVLGRDPRGRTWQEFFPADDRITWLRVLRAPAAGRRPAGGSVHLRLGAVREEGAEITL